MFADANHSQACAHYSVDVSLTRCWPLFLLHAQLSDCWPLRCDLLHRVAASACETRAEPEEHLMCNRAWVYVRLTRDWFHMSQRDGRRFIALPQRCCIAISTLSHLMNH